MRIGDRYHYKYYSDDFILEVISREDNIDGLHFKIKVVGLNNGCVNWPIGKLLIFNTSIGNWNILFGQHAP